MSFAEDVKNELCQYEASSDADVAMKLKRLAYCVWADLSFWG